MNETHTDGFCTIERASGRIRLLVRHEPAQLPGVLTPRRERRHALHGFAAAVAARLNEARAPQRGKSGRACVSVRAAALVPQPGE